MRRSTSASAAVLPVVLFALAACGGPRSTAPAPLGTQNAALILRVRLPAAFAGTSLAATVFRDGSLEPQEATASVRLSSGACVVTGNERLCTLHVTAPVGLLDVALRASAAGKAESLSGTASRQMLPAGGATVSLAFDGAAARWAFSPASLVAPADGTAHDVPFAVLAQDAQGFILVHDAPQPPTAVAVVRDVLHQLSITAQGGGLFLAQYAGHAADLALSASAPGAAVGRASFSSLVVSPSSLAIDPGKSAPLLVSLAHYQGAFSASSGGANCAVSPASLTPQYAGAPVEFTVRLNSGEGCEITLQAAQFNVPIVIPAKNAVASPGIGIGPSKIQHVVILFQENRSFDNIFGGLDQNGKPFPGADTVSNPNPGEPTPINHLGQPVAMSTGLLEECYDPIHLHANSVLEVDAPTPTSTGKMDRFDEETTNPDVCTPSPAPAPTNYVYRTIEESEVAPYWLMGEQYAISDRMFEPFSSGSYGPHLFVVSGQSGNTIDNPDGAWGCNAVPDTVVDVMDQANGQELAGVFPCFYNITTLGDLLDQRGISWRYYVANNSDTFGYFWNAYRSFNQIYNGPDWTKDIITPPSQFLTDIGNGQLASMTWIMPTNATSDHPQSHSNMGPAWIASVVNAIGTSPFWDSTAIFVTWDDWGGWYDHVPPPVTTPYFSQGVRVPLIVISPYAKKGYVSHVIHSSGSILHFAEEVLNLPSLGEEDARRDDLMDAFNFSQKPTPFATFLPAHSKAEVFRAASGSADDRMRKSGDDGD